MDLSCPRCGDDLPWVGDAVSLSCVGCTTEWPVIGGVPDLRLYPDPYIEILEDREKARRLHKMGEVVGASDLIEKYFSITPEVPPGLAEGYRRGMLELGPARAEDRLERLTEELPVLRKRPRILDLGCGAGAWLPALSDLGGEVVGVDVALRWLVVARRVLMDAGVNARLICANAEALPFPQHRFDLVVGANVLEHTRDPAAALDEVFRVLDKDGAAYLATPNRFSVLPEPHVGIPGLGLLPLAVADEVVRRFKGVPYGGITLQGSLGLMDLVTAAGFRRVVIDPALPGPREARMLSAGAATVGRLLRVAQSLPGARTVLKTVGPTLEVKAFKGPNRKRIGVGRRSRLR